MSAGAPPACPENRDARTPIGPGLLNGSSFQSTYERLPVLLCNRCRHVVTNSARHTLSRMPAELLN